METSNLYIPVNIKTRFEFFDGFGFGLAELMPTIAAALVSGLIAVVVHAAGGGMVASALIVLVTIDTSAMALAKGENNLSVVDQTKCVLRFLREQRQYSYYYADEWGDDT
jgi:hypothetical protein